MDVAQHERGMVLNETNTQEILDGSDSNQDIHQLLGFCSTLDTDTEACVFLDLAEAWIDKYGIHQPIEVADD